MNQIRTFFNQYTILTHPTNKLILQQSMNTHTQTHSSSMSKICTHKHTRTYFNLKTETYNSIALVLVDDKMVLDIQRLAKYRKTSEQVMFSIFPNDFYETVFSASPFSRDLIPISFG